MTSDRLLADRRSGMDRRTAPRRATLAGASPERRRQVDRRRGAERRSTLDRRDHAPRDPSVESPREHLRNALQLLMASDADGGLHLDMADLAAVVQRLEHALQLLERRPRG